MIKNSAVRKQKFGGESFEAAVQPKEQELVGALRTLYELLERYAPPWYTQQHHDEAAAALGIKDKPCGE